MLRDWKKGRRAYVGLAAAIAFAIALLISLTNYRASYHVEVKSEFIKVTINNGSRLSWPLLDASLNTPENVIFGIATITIGNPEKEVSIELVRTSPERFYMNLSTVGDSVGYIETEDGTVKSLSNTVTIEQEIEPLNAFLGASLTYQIAGAVTLGTSDKVIDGYSPSLLSGKIVIRGHATLSDKLYTTDAAKLSLGDILVFVDSNNDGQISKDSLVINRDQISKVNQFSAYGLVRMNKDTPFMEVVVDQVADFVRITRYRTQGYTVSLTWYDKIIHDATIQALWAVFAFLLISYSQLSKKGEKEQ